MVGDEACERIHKITRREVEGDNGREGGRVFRNKYKGHMDKTKVGVESGEGGRDGWGGGGVVGRICGQLYLNNNKLILKKEIIRE